MAKKVDVSFMRFVYSDDEWVREVKEPTGSLLIVDVYNKSFGPTEMLATHFQNYFFDLGEKVGLRFVRAERDKLKHEDVQSVPLGSSAPLFLFYLDGELKEKVDGPIIPDIKANIDKYAPVLTKE